MLHYIMNGFVLQLQLHDEQYSLTGDMFQIHAKAFHSA